MDGGYGRGHTPINPRDIQLPKISARCISYVGAEFPGSILTSERERGLAPLLVPDEYSLLRPRLVVIVAVL